MSKNISVVPAFDFTNMVSIAGSQVVTTSAKIAEYFGKKHKTVLRSIRNLKCSEDFTRRNFVPTDFIDKNGDIQPMYNMTKDGCMFLIMGFTGEAAAAIKECYINAFNWMAETLNRRQMMGEQAQHQYVIKDKVSKVKASMGSRLMNQRKKEIPLLKQELERVKALTTPDLFGGLLS
ncbi:Rha family transcriptional regulator [Pragia fontium]|uniref:Rha family transcriptional regulator n=1 Tax=Pragia fontium TaxID=82985 RepID=UPI000F6D7AE2|nr:Rha family transcriptional regulator [Pragia fontium]VEJ54639.1 Uncharacterized phage-encoded protein [Pragia fontium]